MNSECPVITVEGTRIELPTIGRVRGNKCIRHSEYYEWMFIINEMDCNTNFTIGIMSSPNVTTECSNPLLIYFNAFPTSRYDESILDFVPLHLLLLCRFNRSRVRLDRDDIGIINESVKLVYPLPFTIKLRYNFIDSTTCCWVRNILVLSRLKFHLSLNRDECIYPFICINDEKSRFKASITEYSLSFKLPSLRDLCKKKIIDYFDESSIVDLRLPKALVDYLKL